MVAIGSILSALAVVWGLVHRQYLISAVGALVLGYFVVQVSQKKLDTAIQERDAFASQVIPKNAFLLPSLSDLGL